MAAAVLLLCLTCLTVVVMFEEGELLKYFK